VDPSGPELVVKPVKDPDSLLTRWYSGNVNGGFERSDGSVFLVTPGGFVTLAMDAGKERYGI
jgi:hypothetical protein